MIGVDIEKNERFSSWDKKKLKRIYDDKEIEYAFKTANPFEHICGFFCVKEALVKALKKQDLKFNKVVVLHKNDGAPYIELNEYTNKIFKQFNILAIELSISHTNDYSVAVVQIVKDREQL